MCHMYLISKRTWCPFRQWKTGYKVAFNDGKVHVWKKYFKDDFTLGFRVDSLYQVGGSPLGVMSCDTTLQSELWHCRFAHLHYKALPDVRKMVTWMLEFRLEQEGVCTGCAEGKLKRGPFPSSQSKTSDILQLVHLGISEASIKRETTTPRTLEQNGVARRKNRTIAEVVWAMLHDQRLLKFLWVETTNTAVYVQN